MALVSARSWQQVVVRAYGVAVLERFLPVELKHPLMTMGKGCARASSKMRLRSSADSFLMGDLSILLANFLCGGRCCRGVSGLCKTGG